MGVEQNRTHDRHFMIDSTEFIGCFLHCLYLPSMVLNQHPPIRLEPAPGMVLLCLPDSRFKRAQLEVHFDHYVGDGLSPARTLLVRLLEQGSARHPSQMAITRAEELLYGAEIQIDGDRLAESHRFSLGMAWVGDRFLPKGAGVEHGTLSLGRELLTEPLRGAGGELFPPASFERERQQLVRRIQSLKDDRAAWAHERFLACLCADEPYGIPPWGSAEQIAALEPEDCERARLGLLASAPLTAVAVGPINPDELATWLESLGGDRTKPLPSTTTRDAGELREVREHLAIDQARFLMGFRFTPPADAEQMEALSLTSSLLGGGTHSRLFRVVREERSLCYGISSSIRTRKGILTVGAGIDADSYEEVRDEVLNQIGQLACGEFSEKELSLTKVNLLNDLDALGDSAPSLAGFFTREEHLGFGRTPACRAEMIKSIGRDQIMATAAGFAPDLAYLLSGDEN